MATITLNHNSEVGFKYGKALLYFLYNSVTYSIDIYGMPIKMNLYGNFRWLRKNIETWIGHVSEVNLRDNLFSDVS